MKIKKNWIQVIVWGLCVAVMAGLVYIVREDRRNRQELIAQLQQHAAMLAKEDSDKAAAAAEIFDSVVQNLRTNDIVCWGDSEMAGTKENSLAKGLAEVVNEELYGSLMKAFSKYLTEGEHDTPSIQITNLGVSGEGMRQILVRAGVNDMEVGEWTQIPGDTEPVALTLMDDEAWENKDELRFAKQSDVSFGQVWIADIEGTLVQTDDWYDSNHPRYAFVRDEEGDGKGVSSGTTVEIESATRYIGDTPIFFFSGNITRSVDGFMSDVIDLVDRYAGSDDDDEEDDEEDYYARPFVVICTTVENTELDKAMRNEFGDRYIRNETPANSMTSRAFNLLAQRVYDNLDGQGCFDSAKEKIAKALIDLGGL